MRISDWSSDVCSSDLPDLAVAQRGARHQPPVAARRGIEEDERRVIDRARGARTQAEIDSERHRAADPDIGAGLDVREGAIVKPVAAHERPDRKSTRLNSSH